LHYYKFNIADWGLGTSHLSLEEEAIYFRLINYYYDNENPIPLETQSVFRRLRFGSDNELATSILTEFFEETDKGWIHSRCENVLKDYRKTAKKNKVNGAKGGRPKKDAASSISQKKPSGLPDESQNNPNQEPLTTNHKPLTKETKTIDQSTIDHEFENVWTLYGKKGNGKTSKAKFSKLKDSDRLDIINHIPLYVLSTPEKKYRKNFETYLNQHAWKDEVQTHEENRVTQYTARLSASDQVRAKIEIRRAERAADRASRGSLDNSVCDVRREVHKPVRIGAEPNVDGRTFENDGGTDNQRGDEST